MASAPTGCYKCGRPGHWSRDCPSSAPIAGTTTASPSSQIPNNEFQKSSTKSGNHAAGTSIAPVPKVKKTRPKLTPDLLLSDDGLGYVLRYFPKSFKYHGRGKEVTDLGNLIRLYSEWHSHLLPYYSFDQFVHKVQQVATTKRVKNCINELRERVASGVEPNKLYEKQEETFIPSDDQGNLDMDHSNHNEENIPSKSADVDIHADTNADVDIHADTNADAFQDNMMNEILDNAMDSSNSLKVPSDKQDSEVTEKQRERMEANRLKAMEKAKDISEEQRLRMEANRLKALERVKARLQSNQD